MHSWYDLCNSSTSMNIAVTMTSCTMLTRFNCHQKNTFNAWYSALISLFQVIRQIFFFFSAFRFSRLRAIYWHTNNTNCISLHGVSRGARFAALQSVVCIERETNLTWSWLTLIVLTLSQCLFCSLLYRKMLFIISWWKICFGTIEKTLIKILCTFLAK